MPFSQEQPGQHRITYMWINERSPSMPVLYVSPSRRLVLLGEPEDFIDSCPADNLLSTRDMEELKKQYTSRTDDNVLMTEAFVRNKLGQILFIRNFTFVCGNINTHVSAAYPGVTLEQQNRRTLTIKRFRYNVYNDDSDGARASNSTPVPSLRTIHQASMVVENAGASNPACDAGPTILFAADSINRILDADSSDLQGLPFLSIVAFEDIPKAAAFLANALHSSEPLFERLSILVNPIEESNSTNPRIAALEFMGIGSDDGAILLCQLLPPSAQERSDNDGYLSLGDIISSDPDTSDYPELWDLMDLE